MIQNPAQPLLHYDKEKGIKYVNNIPYFEERDLKYLSKKIPEVERLAKECRQQRENIEKTLFGVQDNIGGLKQKVEEISIKIEEDKKKFIPDLKNEKDSFKKFIFDLNNQTVLRIKTFNNETQQFLNNSLQDKDLIEKTLQLIKDTKEQIEETKYRLKRRQFFQNISIEILVYFMALVVLDAFIWTKNHSGKMLVFAFKAINLTKFNCRDGEL